MSYYIFKLVITGIIVVIITETAKFNLKLAALITAMPIVTLLCIFWMYYEGMEKKEISEYVFSTLKYLIPTIPMFVLFPILIERTNFYITVFLCCLSISIEISGNLVYLPLEDRIKSHKASDDYGNLEKYTNFYDLLELIR